MLFQSADVLPDDVDFVGPGIDLLERVARLIGAHGGSDPTTCHAQALRMWAGLHGLTSLRIHKPTAPWTAITTTDATALVASFLAQPTPEG